MDVSDLISIMVSWLIFLTVSLLLFFFGALDSRKVASKIDLQ